MERVRVSKLKQCPYGYMKSERVDPTREDVQKAIEEERFCEYVMDRDYKKICAQIQGKSSDPRKMNQLMRQFHAERIAELVRAKDSWLNTVDDWPITIDQFNDVTAGNHRFRAIRYLEIEEIDVKLEKVDKRSKMHDLPEIW